MNTLRHAVLALATALLATVAADALADGKGFRVDLVAFTQPAADGTHYWQDTRMLPPCHAVALHDGGGATAAFENNAGCIRKPGLDVAVAGYGAAGNSTLGAQAAKLKKSGYAVLLDRGWRQSGLGLSPVLLRGGRTLNGRQEIEGTITIGGTEKTPEATLDLTLTRMDGDKPQYVTLQETRKLKSGELNYLDHPLFGVILQVTAPDATP